MTDVTDCEAFRVAAKMQDMNASFYLDGFTMGLLQQGGSNFNRELVNAAQAESERRWKSHLAKAKEELEALKQ